MRTKDFDEEEVLRKAIAIFWEKGYNATSLYDLIDGLGIGRSSIYHAFGDKHTLFIKALELYQQEGIAKIKALLDDAPNIKAGIENVLRSVINDVIKNECPKGCFKVNSEVELASQDELIKKMVYDDDLIIGDLLHDAIKSAQVNGEISPSKNALALARFICTAVTGMRVYAKFRTDKQYFEDVVTTTLSVL